MNYAWNRRGLMVFGMVVGICLGNSFATRWAGQAVGASEGEQSKAPATAMAMMDVAYIYKNHKPFNEKMGALTQKAQDFQHNMKTIEAQLQVLKGRVEQATDKSEKVKLEAELARQSTDYQLLVRTNQTDIGDAEAKIYYDTYQLLQEETKNYCRSRGIHVVLKFVRDPIKADDRNSVMQGLARPIIFSDAPDISDDILKALNAAAEVKAAKAKQEETKSR